MSFGEYGGPDQMGAGSNRPNPSIPLGWINTLCKAGNSVYIPSNGAIVKVKLGYAKQWDSKTGKIDSTTAVSKVKSPAQTLVNVYPSPSHGNVAVQLTLPKKEAVSVSIYSVDGKLIRSIAVRQLEAGSRQISWDGRDGKANKVNAGMYLAQVKVGNQLYEKSLMLIK